jgi:hypothetical protein
MDVLGTCNTGRAAFDHLRKLASPIVKTQLSL